MEDDEYSDPAPPTAEKVAQRAIVLSVVACRGIVEGNNRNSKEAAGLVEQAIKWLLSLGFEDQLSNWERGLFDAPFGSLTRMDLINASWLSEAVAILAWSLGRVDLLGFDVQCDPSDTANHLGFMREIGETVLSRPVLRDQEVLREYNEFIYHLHWRVRDYSLNRRRYDFESLAIKAWGESVLRHGLKIAERDLCVGGVPISDAKEEDWRMLVSITQERHRASNWLIGYASENFYEVTTDT